jgi:transcriptional regulator with XRE-family HTH domain
MVEFGKRLKKLRQQHNLTQKQLASLIGVQNAIISFYEVGERNPSPEIIVKLASVFHVTTDYLMGLERGECVDVSGLDENDKALIRKLVERLGEKG